MRSGGFVALAGCGVAVCVVMVQRYGGPDQADTEATGDPASGFPYCVAERERGGCCSHPPLSNPDDQFDMNPTSSPPVTFTATL